MTKQELGTLVEEIIRIRDIYRDVLTRNERDTLADACNIIDQNINLLAEENDG